MKRALAVLLLLALALPVSAKPRRKLKGPLTPAEPAAPFTPPLYPVRSTEPIIFVWPPENMPLAAEAEFILGSISPATAHFTINGTTIQVHESGGFLAWLPISPGTFTFRGELTLSSGTATAERRILVPLPILPPTGKLTIDATSLSPKI